MVPEIGRKGWKWWFLITHESTRNSSSVPRNKIYLTKWNISFLMDFFYAGFKYDLSFCLAWKFPEIDGVEVTLDVASHQSRCFFNVSVLTSHRLGCFFNVSLLASHRLGCFFNVSPLASHKSRCFFNVSLLTSHRLGCFFNMNPLASHRLGCFFNVSPLTSHKSGLLLPCISGTMPMLILKFY